MMNFLNWWFRKRSQEDLTSPIRQALFGDMPLEMWPLDDADDSPWQTFSSARSHLAAGSRAAAIACWHEILDYPDVEARHYLQAWHFLRQQGVQPPTAIAKQVLGAVIEPDNSAPSYWVRRTR